MTCTYSVKNLITSVHFTVPQSLGLWWKNRGLETYTKGLKLTEEKAVILISKTTLIDETLKFPRMRWAMCQGMVSQNFIDT